MLRRKKYRRNRRSRERPLLGLTLLITLVTGLALGVGMQYAALAKTEISLNLARSRLEELKRQSDWLETQLASMTSPARIEELATTRLGMVRPKEIKEITVVTSSPVVAASLVGSAERTENKEGILQKLVDRLSQGIQRAQAKPKK